MTTADARLTLALNLVQAAGQQALAGVERCQVEWKRQGERVTNVDREVQARMVDAVNARFLLFPLTVSLWRNGPLPFLAGNPVAHAEVVAAAQALV